MKVLSILQPCASLCVTTDPKTGKAYKQIETRSWDTKFRGPLLIHASKKWSQDQYNTMLHIGAEKPLAESGYHLVGVNKSRSHMMTNLPLGAIIGMVNVVSTFQSELNKVGNWYQIDKVTGKQFDWEMTEQELAFGDYSPGRYGWLLSDPILFKNPIPCKGNLGLWNLPENMYDIVIHKLEEATGGKYGLPGGFLLNMTGYEPEFTPSLIASPGEGAVIVEPEEEQKSKCFEFPAFGASYPDAQCSGGYLWDLDSVEDGHFTSGGDIPCPVCNPAGYIEHMTNYEPGDPEYDDEQMQIQEHMKFIYERYGKMEYVPPTPVPPSAADGHDQLMQELKKSEIN